MNVCRSDVRLKTVNSVQTFSLAACGRLRRHRLFGCDVLHLFQPPRGLAVFGRRPLFRLVKNPPATPRSARALIRVIASTRLRLAS